MDLKDKGDELEKGSSLKYDAYTNCVGNVPNFFQASRPTEVRLEQDRERRLIFPHHGEVCRHEKSLRLKLDRAEVQKNVNFETGLSGIGHAVKK